MKQERLLLSGGNLKALRKFACATALEAGAILHKGFGRTKQVEYKGRIDPVTEYDLKSEALIVKRIQKQYPDHSLICEEGSELNIGSEYQWIIDPLDGTVNYAHSFPIYCVSIGLLYLGEPIVGAVFDPERNELFSGAKGQGATLNKKRIHVTNEGNLERALLATGFAYNIATAKRNNLGLFARVAKKAQAVRRPGSAALDLCWLAAGRIDGFWELFLHPWDTCAASVVITEAGGKMTRVSGRDYSVFDDDLLAANPRLHGKMKALLNSKSKTN